MSNHYRLNDVEPSAIVTVNGSEKKIYDNNQIFLNPNDNFEFRFFNPLQEKVGIEINFDGQKKGNSLLILNPGEDITLDRFLDDKKKMKYSTYFINGKNDQAVKATEKNGLVTINFYKEELWNNNFWSGDFNTAGWSGGTSRGTLPHFTNSRSSKGFDGGNQMYSSLGVFTQELDDSVITTDAVGTDYSEYICENTDKNIEYSDYVADSMDVSATYTANLGDTTKSFTTQNQTYEKLETGRIEKGEESNQDFETVDTKFQSTPFHTINYMLKPESTKPQSVNEIRNYCSRCGYRIRKQSWNYCPKCSCEL